MRKQNRAGAVDRRRSAGPDALAAQWLHRRSGRSQQARCVAAFQ